MKLAVRLFARARDLAGRETVEIDVPNAACVADVRAALCRRYPGLRPMASSLLVAVGNTYASDDTAVAPDREIACFPPVSGG